jgi:hypothetical protein
VFGRNTLAGVTAPLRIDYALELRAAAGTTGGAVRMEVRSVDADGRKAVFFDMLEGAARRSFGPVEMTTQNPLLIVFLQRDVQAMEAMTGGSQHYFRNRLRAAFSGPAEVTPIEIRHGGASVPATRVTIRPFAADPRIDRFPAYRDKAYEFIVADAVPGGVWRLATRTTDPGTGELVLEASYTFQAAAAAPAAAAQEVAPAP